MGMLLWYWRRNREDNRQIRRMTRGLYRPWTGRMLAVMLLLTACISLWVFDPPALAEGGDPYVVTAATGTVNIRADPWLGAKVIGYLYPGDTVTVTDYRSGWLLAAAPIEAGQGWVSADYLTLAGTTTGTYRNDSGGRVRIRTEPGGDSAAWLPKGHTVEVRGWIAKDGTQWAETAKGYIDGAYLSAVQ